MIEMSAGIISAGEPMPDDPETAHEMAMIDEEKLQALGQSLAERKDSWVQAKRASGIEKRWMEDLDQYHGRDRATKHAASMMDSAEQGYPITNKDAKPQRSTLYVNITRPKTNSVEARLANMLFPSDDRNWGMIPAPSPELTKAAIAEAKAMAAQAAPQAQQPDQSPQPAPAAQQQPQQLPGTTPPVTQQPSNAPPVAPGMPPQIVAPGMPAPANGVANNPVGQGMIQAHQQEQATATAQLQEATERCNAMQNEIDDQLIDCQFNGEGRKLIHHSAVLGTGILKGPIVVNCTRKAWQPADGQDKDGVYILEIVEEKKPASEAVSPWNVFPDPSCGSDVHNGRGIYEYRDVTAKQLRELANQPGYLKEQISKVLEMGPNPNPYLSEADQKQHDENTPPTHDKDHYQIWEYWGEFSPEDLRLAGVDIPDSSVHSLSGCVIFVNDVVIKGFLNPLETGDIPYDFLPWEAVDGSPWGYGVPFLMRPAQRALNAAWRQLMDNSGLSVGPQIFIKRRGIEPADKQWEITGRKIWLCDDTVNPKDAFASIDINNHGQEIQQIIDLAMKFADEEASIPAINQGEKGNAPDTVGGITILMNSSNVVLSRMVKQYDDCITRPHLRRYYDWNMAYSDKPGIKGDFQVDARGSSALLVRDLQAQSLLQLGQYQGSGVIGPFVNWENWFKQVLKLQHIDPTDIMKTDAEIAQIQDQPAQATPEQVKAQAQLQVAQIRAGAQQQIAQARVAGEIQYAQAESEMAQADAQAKTQQTQMNNEAKAQERQDQLQLAMLQYAHEQKMSLQEVQAELAKTAMIERTKRELAATDLALKQSEGHKDRMHELNTLTHQSNLNQLNQPLEADTQGA